MRISVGAFIPAAPFQAIASRASRRSPAGSGPTHRQTLPLGGGECVDRTSIEQSFKKTSSLRLTEHIVNVCAQLEKLADELKRRHPLWKGCNRRGVGPRRREACRRSTVMLKVIEGANVSFFPREMDAMFRNRAEVFSERLGWDVVVKGGYARDRFDDLNPVYLVSVDPVTERYWGSLR